MKLAELDSKILIIIVVIIIAVIIGVFILINVCLFKQSHCPYPFSLLPFWFEKTCPEKICPECPKIEKYEDPYLNNFYSYMNRPIINTKVDYVEFSSVDNLLNYETTDSNNQKISLSQTEINTLKSNIKTLKLIKHIADLDENLSSRNTVLNNLISKAKVIANKYINEKLQIIENSPSYTGRIYIKNNDIDISKLPKATITNGMSIKSCNIDTTTFNGIQNGNIKGNPEQVTNFVPVKSESIRECGRDKTVISQEQYNTIITNYQNYMTTMFNKLKERGYTISNGKLEGAMNSIQSGIRYDNLANSSLPALYTALGGDTDELSQIIKNYISEIKKFDINNKLVLERDILKNIKTDFNNSAVNTSQDIKIFNVNDIIACPSGYDLAYINKTDYENCYVNADTKSYECLGTGWSETVLGCIKNPTTPVPTTPVPTTSVPTTPAPTTSVPTESLCCNLSTTEIVENGLMVKKNIKKINAPTQCDNFKCNDRKRALDYDKECKYGPPQLIPTEPNKKNPLCENLKGGNIRSKTTTSYISNLLNTELTLCPITKKSSTVVNNTINSCPK